MIKELIISIIIVITIVTGDILTTKYTNESIVEAKGELAEIKNEIQKNDEEIDSNKVKEQIKKTNENWNKRHKKLAMYLEHNELEKIETDLSSLNGYLEKEEYGDANAQLDISIYVLDHIKNKTTLNIINIF